MTLTADIFIIDSVDKLSRLESYYDKLQPELFVLDVETDSANEQLADLYGIGFCFNPNKAFYIIWRNSDGSKFWSQQEETRIKTFLRKCAKECKLIGHNIIYDIIVMDNTINLDLTEFIYSDTILQKHALDEEPPFALKELAVKELGDWADDAQEDLKEAVLAAGGKWNKNDKDMYLAPSEILGKYCCWDVLLTLELFNIYEAKIKNEGLEKLFYEDEIMDLYREVTIPMKKVGIRVDVDHFQDLKDNILKDIEKLEDVIQDKIQDDVKDFVRDLLNEKVPVKSKGSFPKELAEVLNIPLPVNKSGKITLAKGALEKQRQATPKWSQFYDWIESGLDGVSSLQGMIPQGILTSVLYDYDDLEGACQKAQENLFFAKKPNADKRYVFNLASNDHLGHLLFKVHKLPINPKKRTDKGKPQVDEEVLESYENSLDIVKDLLSLKKLNKLKGTYIEGILDRQIDGRIYASMLQFGTTSGRYASRNPNLQNLPRVPEKKPEDLSIVEQYTASIRKGFISDENCMLIDADYSALEPRCFSHMSGDKKLQELWAKGEDMYSRIAIDVFELKGVSANPKDANYLKTVDPSFRQDSKVFCLAVPYGAEEGRIAQAMGVDWKRAHEIISKYLKKYPGLKKYMHRSEYNVKTKGYVKTIFGRIRHLKEANFIYAIHDDDILDFKWAKSRGLSADRRKYKTCLNNAKNFPIQGLAAHIVNRAMIAIAKELKKKKLKAYQCLQVHDQVIVNCPNDELEIVTEIVQRCMETTTKISVPLIAEPEVADNMADSH